MYIVYLIAVITFTSLLDICLSSEFYQQHQKQLLLSWKQRIESILQFFPSTSQGHQLQHRTSRPWHQNTSISRRSSLQIWSSPPRTFQPSSPSTFKHFQKGFQFQTRGSVPNIKLGSNYPNTSYTKEGGKSTKEFMSSLSSDFHLIKPDTDSPRPTYLFENKADHKVLENEENRNRSLDESELDSRMESLCLSVTEHALSYEP